MSELFLKRLRIGILTIVVINGLLLAIIQIIDKPPPPDIYDYEVWHPYFTVLFFFFTYLFALLNHNHLPGPDGFRKNGFRVHRNLRAFFIFAVAFSSLYINFDYFAFLVKPIPRFSNVTYITNPEDIVFGCYKAQPICVAHRTTLVLNLLIGFLVVIEVGMAFKLRRAMAKTAPPPHSRQEHPFNQSGYRPGANVEIVSPETTPYPVGGMPYMQYQQPMVSMPTQQQHPSFMVQPQQQYAFQPQQQQLPQGYYQGYPQQAQQPTQQQQHGSTPKYEENSTGTPKQEDT